MIIEHQFLHQPWFIPEWTCKTLIVGSFNPSCGLEADYFYGRRSETGKSKNNFWKAVASLRKEKNPNFFHQDKMDVRRDLKIQQLKDYYWGCVDIVRSVDVVDDFLPKICQKYEDSNLFNKKKVSRTYNDRDLLSRISRGDVKTVIWALGKRDSPKEYLQMKREFITECEDLGVVVRDDNVSFSALSTEWKIPIIAQYLKEFI